MRKTICLKDTLFDVDQIQAIKEVEIETHSGMSFGNILKIMISGQWITIRYSKESEAISDRELLIDAWMGNSK